jgi:hypothetical protein
MKKWYQHTDAKQATAKPRVVQQEQAKPANRAKGRTKLENETKTANLKSHR